MPGPRGPVSRGNATLALAFETQASGEANIVNDVNIIDCRRASGNFTL